MFTWNMAAMARTTVADISAMTGVTRTVDDEASTRPSHNPIKSGFRNLYYKKMTRKVNLGLRKVSQ